MASSPKRSGANQVLHARAPLVAVDVAQAADRLDAADLDRAGTPPRRAPRPSAVPCLTSSYHTSTSTRRFCARPGLRRVRRDGLRDRRPIRTRCLRPADRACAARTRRLRRRARATRPSLSPNTAASAGDSGWLSAWPTRCSRTLRRSCMPSRIFAQLGDRAVRNLGDADVETDRRHEVRELDGLELPRPRPRASRSGRRPACLEQVRVVHPLRERARRPASAARRPRRAAARSQLRVARAHASAPASDAQHVIDALRVVHSRLPCAARARRSARRAARTLRARSRARSSSRPRPRSKVSRSAGAALHARVDELRVLEIGEIRQAQHGRRLAQLVSSSSGAAARARASRSCRARTRRRRDRAR